MVSRGKVGNSQHFPTNLHILLDEAERENHSHIVSWYSQGQSFKIHNQDAIVPLLAKYFRQTKFKSFLRQLQSYGFHRTTRGCDKGTVSHPLFVRGRRSLSYRMTRKLTGAAAATSHSVIPRQLNSSANLAYQPVAVPSNGIMPIRKTHSAPIFKSGMQRNVAFTELSEMHNETFGYQGNLEQDVSSNHHHLMNNYLINKIASSPPRRRSSTSTSLYSSNSPDKGNFPMMRRSSDPAIMSSEQRDSILKCAEIDYRTESSPDNTRVPREGFLLSIEESSTGCSATKRVLSQQQVPFQVQSGDHHEHLSQLLPQDQDIFQQVQRAHEPQNQVHIQQLQYQQEQEQEQEQEPHHQVYVKYQAQQQHRRFPENVKKMQCPLELQHSIHVQHDIKPQVEQVYSRHQVEEKVKQARQDMAKHFRDQYSSTKFKEQSRLCYPSDKPQSRQYRQQQQQVEFHGMQNQQVVQQQECEQPNQQQPHLLQHKEKLHQSTQVQYVQVQRDRVDPQQSVFVAPHLDGCSFLGSQVYSDQPSLNKKSSDLYAVPSSSFDLSFSTTEFKDGSVGKDDNHMVLSVEAPTCYQSREANTVDNTSSFSIAISTPTLGGLPLSNGLARTMTPRCGTTDDYRMALRPTTTHSVNHTHQRTQTVVPAIFLQQQQQQQQHVPARATPVEQCRSSAEITTTDHIDQGTVDFLLQNGSGGCDEWEMQAEDLVDYQNYYSFFNTTDMVDSASTNLRLSDHHVHRPNHIFQ